MIAIGGVINAVMMTLIFVLIVMLPVFLRRF